MRYNSFQKNILTPGIITEIRCVKCHFIDEVNRWKQGGHKIKLLILAEAPLSCKKYLYNDNPGNFLYSLKHHFQVGPNEDFLARLRIEGVFVVDMYEFPIDTSNYDSDRKSHQLFNDNYLLDVLNFLRKSGLLTELTRVVFRYKKLVDRYFDMKRQGINTSSLDSIPYHQWIFGTLNINERPQEISPVVKFYI